MYFHTQSYQPQTLGRFKFGRAFKKLAPFALAPFTGGASLLLHKGIRKGAFSVAKIAVPVAAVGAALFFGGPAAMAAVTPLLGMLTGGQRQKVQDVATQGGFIPGGLPPDFYAQSGYQPGQYLQPPQGQSGPMPQPADFPGQPRQDLGPQFSQAGILGLSPMMLMIGGATLLGVFLFQKKG